MQFESLVWYVSMALLNWMWIEISAHDFVQQYTWLVLNWCQQCLRTKKNKIGHFLSFLSYGEPVFQEKTHLRNRTLWFGFVDKLHFYVEQRRRKYKKTTNDMFFFEQRWNEYIPRARLHWISRLFRLVFRTNKKNGSRYFKFVGSDRQQIQAIFFRNCVRSFFLLVVITCIHWIVAVQRLMFSQIHGILAQCRPCICVCAVRLISFESNCEITHCVHVTLFLSPSSCIKFCLRSFRLITCASFSPGHGK